MPGRRGRATRQRLLERTAEMLRTETYRDLKVIDIAREAGTSPATFYQYFADVEAAILVLADEASDDAQFLADLLQDSWLDAGGEARALGFVRAFMDYWDRHRAVLRVRDLRAEEGDKRFWSARLDGYAAIIPGFTTMIEKGQAAGSVSSELNAYAAASALAAMMERLVTYRSEFGRRGVSTEAMTATLATVLFQTVTGFTS